MKVLLCQTTDDHLKFPQCLLKKKTKKLINGYTNISPTFCQSEFMPLILQSISNINGLVQDCGNSIANAMELPQSCTKPSMLYHPLICRPVARQLSFILCCRTTSKLMHHRHDWWKAIKTHTKTKSEVYFTCNFSIKIQIRRQFHFGVTRILHQNNCHKILHLTQ